MVACGWLKPVIIIKPCKHTYNIMVNWRDIMLKNHLCSLVLIILFAYCFTYAQMMGHRCPMCGRSWDGTYADSATVPKKLPEPKNQSWINDLKASLSKERLSRAQYENDRDKYNVGGPYMMIIPQEYNHITWISDLFRAYGMKVDSIVPQITKTSTVQQAYQVAMNIESSQVPIYEKLIKNAEDDTTKQIINTILLQTRMHYTMFNHMLRMGSMGCCGMGH